ncbi:MAG: hypothetical protein II347_03900, partial [Lachnospiraceae bacterium]|nr:hypothetical protein [Lachnospiraceae bacterium]
TLRQYTLLTPSLVVFLSHFSIPFIKSQGRKHSLFPKASQKYSQKYFWGLFLGKRQAFWETA